MGPKPTLVMVTLKNAMKQDQFTPHVDKLGGHVVNSYVVDDSHYVLQLPDTVPADPAALAAHDVGIHQPAPPAPGGHVPPPDPVVTTVTTGLAGIGTVSQIHWCH